MPTFQNLVQMFQFRANEHGPKKAYEFLEDGESISSTLTYEDTDAKARAIALGLLEHRPQGRPIILVVPPGVEFIAGFFGCLYAGAVVVPAYPPRGRRALARLRSTLIGSGATTLLTTTKIAKELAHPPEWPPLEVLTIDTVPPSTPEGWSPSAILGDSPAVVQYTSGSTSEPKGVILSHANILDNCENLTRIMSPGTDSHAVVWVPPYHDMGLVGGIIQPAYAGFPVTLIPPDRFAERPARWLAAITRAMATFSCGPNSGYELCVDRVAEEEKVGLDLKSWRVAFNGAERVRADTMNRFASAFGPLGFRKNAFFPVYGLAETTLIATGPSGMRPQSELLLDPVALQNGRVRESRLPGARSVVGCGTVLRQHTLAIVDPETDRPCDSETIGEIRIAGSSVAAGYWNAPDATQHTFQSRIPGDGRAFLRTGDLGFLWQGELYVTGRLTDQIVIRGEKYHPEDIEHHVGASHRALQHGGGVAFLDDAGDTSRLVIVHELLRPHLSANTEEVVNAMRALVRKEMNLAVDEIVLVKTGGIPRTANGKLQRRACRDAWLRGELPVIASTRPASRPAPDRPLHREDVELFLREAISHETRVSLAEIRLDDPMVSLAMRSLEATSVAAAVKQRFGVRIDMDTLYSRSLTLSDVIDELFRQASRANFERQPPPQPALAPVPPQVRVPCDGHTVLGLFEGRVLQLPQSPALVFGETSLSYAQLDDESKQVARRLVDLGVAQGDLVGIVAAASASLVASVLGVLRCGAAVQVLSADEVRQPERGELPAIVLLPDNDVRSRFEDGRTTFVCVGDAPRPKPQPPRRETGRTMPDGRTSVFSDSRGLYGRLDNEQVCAFFAEMDKATGGKLTDALLTGLTDFDVRSLCEILWTLCRGATVVLAPARGGLASPVPSTRRVDLSLLFFASKGAAYSGDKYRLFFDASQLADANGFRRVWIPERHFHEFGGAFPNPATLAAALAMRTSRVRLSAGSVVLPLHNPVRVAEEWSVVDNLSEGRVDLSFAMGWNPDDFVLAPGAYSGREKTFLADIRMVERLWAGETLALRNGEGRLVNVRVHPRPRQDRLTSWVTCSGGGSQRFADAGTIGANVLTALLFQSADELRDNIAKYRQARARYGWAGPGTVTLMLHSYVHGDEVTVQQKVREPLVSYLRSSTDLWKRGSSDLEKMRPEQRDELLEAAFHRYTSTASLIGTPDQCLATMERLRSIGVDEIACLIDFGMSYEDAINSLWLLAKTFGGSRSGPEANGETKLVHELIRRYGVRFVQGAPAWIRRCMATADEGIQFRDVLWMPVGDTPQADSGTNVLPDIVRDRLLREARRQSADPSTDTHSPARSIAAEVRICRQSTGALGAPSAESSTGRPGEVVLAPGSGVEDEVIGRCAAASESPRIPEATKTNHEPHGRPLSNNIDFEYYWSLPSLKTPHVLDRVRKYDLPAKLQERGLNSWYQELGRTGGVTCVVGGREVLMFGSNNYLGLAGDPRVRQAAGRAAEEDGTSQTGSRAMNGSTQKQREFEEKLARFLGYEQCLVFTTGYQANIGVLTALANADTSVVLDNRSHASLYDGALIRQCNIRQFAHNDPDDLERVIQAASRPVLVVVEGVYSMDGDIAPLRAISERCVANGACLVVDDAHGLGMLGKGGRGACALDDPPAKPEVLCGTFSKSLASIGGWVASEAKVIDWIRYHGRSMLFSAAIPPASLEAAGAALDILIREPERVERLQSNAGYWREQLQKRGFDTGASASAIVPVTVGDTLKCMAFGADLLTAGVFTNVVTYPAVSRDKAILRTSVMATHEIAHMDEALRIFERVGRSHGVI